jgi:FlaA1/EpsC-like NDP-sugar epimerase
MLRLARKWFGGKVSAVKQPARQQRAISLHELLGRAPVNLDTPEMQRFLAGKRVMVTGAGGSIGSEICRQTMKFCPQQMLLLERAENNLFEIDRELRQRWIGAEITPIVADIVDAERIAQVFETYRPQVVFHCAAHKHVPMMELNPCEAIRNNVLGTKCVADAAAAVDAQAFVMVSSDKAVNPTSVMGATKRVAELYVQAMNSRIEDRGLRIEGGTEALRGQKGVTSPFDHRLSSKGFGDEHGQKGVISPFDRAVGQSGRSSTRFTAVRFGNVLGSSGSVVPIFQRQIEAGGPVTVTHPDMQRYFMTIPEASQLVMQAGAIGQGGEIFVLDMGEPIRILDLAKELIARNGLIVGQDIDIQFTGIRPGEKLYEELSCDSEQIVPTPHEKIHVWQLPAADSAQIQSAIQRLASVIYSDPKSALTALMDCVPEYQPSEPGTAAVALAA